jgi:hypothetical protein
MCTTLQNSDYAVSHDDVCKNVDVLIYALFRKENRSKCQRKTVFTDNLKATYPFLEEDQQAGKEL